MAQRRRMEVAGNADESETNLYSHFEKAAKDLSKLYSLSLSFPKLAFHAGYKHSLERVYQWLALKLQEGKTVSPAEILAYLQNELSNMPSPQGSGSHQSGASINEHQRMQLGLSFPAPILYGGSEGNVSNPQDQDMDLSCEEHGHAA